MTSRVGYALRRLRQRLWLHHLKLLLFSLLCLFVLLTLQFDASNLLLPLPYFTPPSPTRTLVVLLAVAATVALGMTGYLAPGVRYLADSEKLGGLTVRQIREQAQVLAQKLGLRPPRFRVAAMESVPYLAVLDRPGSRDDLLLVPTRPDLLNRAEDLQAVLAHEVGHLWAHTGLQNTLRIVDRAPLKVLEYAGYVLIYAAYVPRVGPLLSLFPGLLYGFLWQQGIRLVASLSFARWNTELAYTNEFLADTVALKLLGLEAVANMLIHVHFRLLVQALLEDLARYLKTLAPYLRLPGPEVQRFVDEHLPRVLQQHPYSVHRAARELLRRFLERFGPDLDLRTDDTQTLSSKDLLARILERVPRQRRLPLAFRTPVSLLALDETGPERYDRYPPYGRLDPGELRNLVRQARETGRLSIADLPSDTHPSILARLQHLLSVAG